MMKYKMKDYLKLLVLCMTLLCAGAWSAQAQDDVLTSVAEETTQADTVKVMSAKMGRNIKNVVIVPEQYLTGDKDRRYPVLYLLHGADGCYSDWSKKTNLDALATKHGMIIVCPDGQDSWYFDSPVDPKMQFETYVSKELVAYIDEHYRTYDSPHMRAITGLSMGGHGGLWLGFRHPDVFGSCGSMSGGVDITKFPNRWKLDKRLGKYETNKKRWADHAVINLVPTLKAGQNIIIDDGYSDFFYQVNLDLHQALLAHKIPHDFIIRPGKHSWNYWVNSLDYQLVFFEKAFQKGYKNMKP